jgi:hypothetical protein
MGENERNPVDFEALGSSIAATLTGLTALTRTIGEGTNGLKAVELAQRRKWLNSDEASALRELLALDATDQARQSREIRRICGDILSKDPSGYARAAAGVSIALPTPVASWTPHDTGTYYGCMAGALYGGLVSGGNLVVAFGAALVGGTIGGAVADRVSPPEHKQE